MCIRDRAYRQANSEVARITAEVNENWVGQGQTEFESQYKLLISKIDDFGEILQDIYNALVELSLIHISTM